MKGQTTPKKSTIGGVKRNEKNQIINPYTNKPYKKP